MALNYVTITGTFDDGTGTALTGTVTFTPSTTVYASGVPVVSTAAPIVAQVIAGALKSPSGGTLQLLATDNAGLTLEGLTGFWYWNVVVSVSGGGQSWAFFLPHSPSTVDLFSLASSPVGGSIYVPLAGGTMTGELVTPDVSISGLTGAVAASRYVGATASAAPVAGTFRLGDFVIDQTGKVWICTTAGTPGTWTAAGPTIPVTIAQGGTGQTTANAGFNALSPQTTLGDIIYENATPAAARLAGNTSATKNFLTQTGTGSVSAAPAWGTIATGDIPSLTTTFSFTSTGAAPSSGTYSAGQVLVDQNGIARVCTVAGTPGTWARVGQQPWQFYVDDYGALGNGKVLGDGATHSNTTFNSATAGFVSGDTGKYLMAHGGNGATAGPTIGTITFSNSTTVTLSSAATATVSNCPFVYGTDDTAAINNAVTAAGNYAQTFSATSPGSGGYYAEVIFGAKIYILGTGPTQVGNGSSTPTFNTQIPLPYPAANGTSQKLVIALTGAGGVGHYQFWDSLIPNLAGTCLVSMLTTSSTPSATFGRQSVIGGPSGAAGYTTPSGGAATGQANTKVIITKLSIWLSIYTNIYATDFRYISAAYGDQGSCQIFAPTGVNTSAVQPYLNNITATAFLNSVGSGIAWPVSGNNADSYIGTWAVEGYEQAYLLSDHFTASHLGATYSDVVVKIDGTLGLAGTQHGIFIQNINAENYNGGLRTNGGTLQIEINWDSENSATPTYDINDGGPALWGWFKFGNKVNNISPIVSGAGNLKVVSANVAPGHMASPPSVPGSTSTATLVYKDATVVVHTGGGVTVSAITVDGTATSQTVAAASSSVPIAVPSGKTIALTYAGGTPTWDWWLT